MCTSRRSVSVLRASVRYHSIEICFESRRLSRLQFTKFDLGKTVSFLWPDDDSERDSGLEGRQHSAWSLICLSRRRGDAGEVGPQSPSPGPGSVIIAARRWALWGREF